MKPGTKINRIVMSDKDKYDIKVNLVRNFVNFGAPQELAEKTVTSGSLPMYMWISKWISKWICHNTDYPQTRHMTNEYFYLGIFAWCHYKATAEKLEAKDVEGGEFRALIKEDSNE